ncbi:MAG: DMT family transporter [Promethearchaeati archaeon]
MVKENIKKGIIFGFFANCFIGLQPIVANARPEYIDPFFYAALTVLFESVVFLPIMIIKRRKIKNDFNDGLISQEDFYSLLYGYRKNKLVLIFIGAVFGMGQILFFIGYRLAGSINGSLAQKSTIFFSLLFGFLFLKEKITKLQILFSIFLFFGLIIAVTEGSFNLLTLNLGVLVIIILTCMWTIAHTLTKPIFEKNEGFPSQIVVIRNGIGAVILFSIFFIIFPIQVINMLLDPVYVFWGFAMGATYSIGLFFWYQTLSSLDVSKASILVSPTPVVTALFATLLLHETFTFFDFLGTLIIIVSIIIIMREK